ncbi:TPD1 protein1 [Sesamum angolense]|uniref:TPD1 protein1 n=1 Tax=Sesamum angolense TaxID=2727404 RepID=A0AAE1WT75_9LAMI|nr:TPD1 protein1 [Sesamum angolense]
MKNRKSSEGGWKACMVKGFAFVFMLLFEQDDIGESEGDGDGGNDNDDGDGSMNRIGAGAGQCSKDSILVFQGATSPLPNGIPTYTVEIQNVCVSESSCSISDIHLSCGWFSSARLINPSVFKRRGTMIALSTTGSHSGRIAFFPTCYFPKHGEQEKIVKEATVMVPYRLSIVRPGLTNVGNVKFVGTYGGFEPVDEAETGEPVFSKENHGCPSIKLLITFPVEDGNDDDRGGAWSKDNIIIYQGPSPPLSDGTPTYTAHIMNVSTTGSCSISNIHLHGGWFSSARKINPTIFRRIAFDDCLVNDGNPLNPGSSISFQYANTSHIHFQSHL